MNAIVLHLLNVYCYWNFRRHKKNYFPLLHCIFSYRFYLRACLLSASLPITDFLPSINISSALLKLSTLRKIWLWWIASLLHAKVGSLRSTGYLSLMCLQRKFIYLFRFRPCPTLKHLWAILIIKGKSSSLKPILYRQPHYTTSHSLSGFCRISSRIRTENWSHKHVT